MTEPPRAHQVRRTELELLDFKVTRIGGAVRYPDGGRYRFVAAIMDAETAPGRGPERHEQQDGSDSASGQSAEPAAASHGLD